MFLNGNMASTNWVRSMNKGRWIFERSSGYAGWRCLECRTWIYNWKPFVCDCN